MLKRIPVALGAALLLGCGTLAGCGGSDSSTKAGSSSETTSSASSAASPSASPQPGRTTTPKAKTSKAKTPKTQTSKAKTPKAKTPKLKDVLAPKTIKPVIRDGKRPRPSIIARPATFKGTVSYGDGVALDVTGIRQGRVTGEGPGVIKGPATSFLLKLSNGGRRSLDVNRVVVTAVYGLPGRIARPVYLDSSQDFAGTVKPGSTSNAVYAFAVPVSQTSKVTVHVDFDAVHAAAVFSGAAD